MGFGGNAQERNLEFYISQGTMNSPVLKDITNQIKANQCDSLVARAGYLPQVNFNGLLMYAPVVNGWGYSEVITNGQNLIGTVNVNQQFFNKKTKEANDQKYGFQRLTLENSRSISLNELKKAITAQYLAAYSAFMEHKYRMDMLSTLYDEEKILLGFIKQGIYRQTDYLLFSIEIRNLRRNTLELDIQYRKEISNLNLICGVDDTTVYDLTLPSIDETFSPAPGSSPLLKRFYYDSLQIQNEKLLTDRKYAPSVGWFSDGGIINNEPKYIYQNFGISFGLSLSLPVYDGNQRKLNYNRIRTMEETRKNYEDFFRFQYNTQLKQLRDELENVRMLGKESEKQIALVLELVEQDKVMMNIGSVSLTDYLMALKNLVEARHGSILYQIREQYILNEINFLKQ
jgi:outer membrane protein TolC